MVARALQARLAPHGRLDALRQFAMFAAAYYAYRIVRGMVDGRIGLAFEHGREIIGVESALHIFVEHDIQAWASGSHLLIAVASWFYLNAQTTIMMSALAWLYVFRNASYYFVRNMMFVAMGVALIGYVVYPTAPPRLFGIDFQFQDTIADVTGVPSNSTVVTSFFNPYAAIPSMHVAVALLLGVPISRLVRWRPVRAFWLAYPAFMTFVVVVTANHFLIDAFLGALTAGFAAVTARWMARARPATWAFARPAEAAV